MLPLPAKVLQRRGSIVQNGILPDRAFDLTLQFVQVRQLRMPGSNPGAENLRVLQIPAKPLNRRAEPRNEGQLRRQEHPALHRLDQSVFHAFRVRERRRSRVFHHEACGRCFLHSGPAKSFLENRLRLRQFPVRGLGDCLFLKLLNDPVKPECNHILCHGIPLVHYDIRHEQDSGSAAKSNQKSARHRSVPRHGISKQAVMSPRSLFNHAPR